MNKTEQIYPWVGWTLIFLVFGIKSMNFPIHDFANYYFSGMFFKEGLFTTSIYFPEVFNLAINNITGQSFFVSYAPNTPFLPIVFFPFTFLSIEDAKWLFNLISAVLFIISMRRFTTYFEVDRVYIWLLPLFFLIPIYNNLLFGQMYFLILFLLSEGLIAYDQGKWWLMSGYWGVAIMLKVFPIVVIPFLLVQKSYRAVLYLGLSTLTLFLVSVGVSGVDVWVFYWNEVLPRFSNGEIAGAFVDNYQSVSMFLKRLWVYDPIFNEYSIWNSSVIYETMIWGFKSLMLLITVFLTSRISGKLFRFSLWFLFSMLISAYGSTYGLLILIFLFFALGQLEIDYRFKVGLLLFLFFTLNSTVIQGLDFPWNYIRMYCSLGLLGILVWNYRNQLPLRWIFGIVGIVMILGLINVENNKIAFNSYKTPLLTYHYEIEKGHIKYTYWDLEGEQNGYLKMNIGKWDHQNVEVKENQIYYKGRQLTFDSGNKKKAIMIDNKIVFLSDYGYGLGFYGLFEIGLNEE